ncbi:VCBS repeat-containing protein [Sulfitobacter sp. CW3]|uniref:FG-GAP repeat domain-containing protein n=1 Tax=Sulfitobacter sp. CW3 TaxID=2861965 RepID=UPI001C6021F1|nr:VCBS repeat-containing protein [Sulfitobacter sp. CW3]MBW4960418.1 VCBS repeat-containing protein [Sulfitobacter sp. CW3]
MVAGARRQLAHLPKRFTRHAQQLLCVALTVLAPGWAAAQTITAANYADPTTRYDHGILGDAIEWGTLEITLDDGIKRRFILPETLVFEDTAPRLADLDGDGSPEIIVVESSLTAGARLTVYGPNGRLAMTDHIGRKNRWLAPVGAADFTGDGRLEIAMVVTPHLAGKLVILAFDGAKLSPVATTTNLTNHRIGDTDIAGGIRTCDNAPQMILAQMPWRSSGDTTMVAVSLVNGTLKVAPFKEPFTAQNIAQAKSCRIHPR